MCSIQHDKNFNQKDPNDVPETCRNRAPAAKILVDPSQESQTVIFTYSIDWVPSDIEWTDRWQVYLLMLDNQIHWFSIINSLMIVLFLTGMVAMIMIRTLRADLRKYNMPLDQEDIQEETGWKLVHGDVFRPPKWRMFLSVLCGTGVQVFAMYLITMRTRSAPHLFASLNLTPAVFAILGFLSPANRGGLLMAVPVLFVLMGYATASELELCLLTCLILVFALVSSQRLRTSLWVASSGSATH